MISICTRFAVIFTGMLLSIGVSNAADQPPTDSTPTPTRVIQVYYFHTTARCHSCIQIEKICNDVIGSTLAPEVKRGLVKFQMVNTDLAANAHFMTDYKLFTKSVVLVEQQDGKQVRYKVLNKLWEILNNPAAAKRYLAKEITAYTTSG
jgi:hypothetical protein